ncbi:unnamed protein product [Caenorhabditis auriculariae]|uniref:Glutamyl-tRNA(Gln) amidotransferase subunit C, mitochondrial n=1 Tax=Caenorhabditis auriculariae TaxID=2777116 RepID=A0A8S1HFC5_9PELO|nr:unnamed protein product [Caenorhabditis auriculariae]
MSLILRRPGRLFNSIAVRWSNNDGRKGAGEKKTPLEGDEVLVPVEPYRSDVFENTPEDMPQFDQKLISQLERLSLVRFDSEQAVANLRQTVRIANRLKEIDVEGVEPMHSVWEEQECPVFEDIAEKPLPVEEVLRNAKVRYEEYFVTPPGNVPLESNAPLDLEKINQWDTRGQNIAPQHKKTKRTKQ